MLSRRVGSSATARLSCISECATGLRQNAITAAALSIDLRPSVRLIRQHERDADPRYFLPRPVRYSITADGNRSCRSSRPPTLLTRDCS